MQQDGRRLENKTPRQIINMDPKTELKRLLCWRAVCQHCKKNNVLENNKPEKALLTKSY